jgi:DNA mismatch repair protein MutL
MSIDRVVLLDENTANRIAAGEVVERPASAVKELVENAVDAGATQVVVTLEEGGKERLTVTDNGCGMTRNDAILALQRHATSKIRTADDLFAIRTLGFRGEALPSIASVSQMTVTTKPHDEESGTCIRIHGGDMEAVEEVAARDGTTIEVYRLFFNTPARLKFLKSTPTEVARTVEMVGHLAAAYPEVAFRLRHGGQDVFSTPGTGEPLAAFAAIWGRDIAKKLIPVRHEGAGLTVTGFIATPDVSRPGRSHELFCVNRRPIKSRLLGHALEEAFRALTPDARYPIGALFVDIHPDLVDVNVHPTKTEVKFTRDGEVHHAASQAVKGALLAYGIVPTPRTTVPVGPESGTANFPMQEQTRLALGGEGGTASAGQNDRLQTGFQPGAFQPNPFPSEGYPSEGFPSVAAIALAGSALSAFDASERGVDRSLPAIEGGGMSADTSLSPPLEAPPQLEEAIVTRPRPRPFAEQLRDFKVLGQARNTYIIALTPDGLAVIDQHVAHERVLYERLTVKRFSNGIPVQRLAVPLTVNLGRREALLLAEHCGTFAASGWEIEPFGKDSFAVRSVPAMLVNKPYEQVLRDMIDELVNQTVSRRLLVQQDHVTITNACKMAVKAGDPLTQEEMESLLVQLAETENPYLCPHGRPIVVTIGFHELDKQFKRA